MHDVGKREHNPEESPKWDIYVPRIPLDEKYTDKLSVVALLNQKNREYIRFLTDDPTAPTNKSYKHDVDDQEEEASPSVGKSYIKLSS